MLGQLITAALSFILMAVIVHLGEHLRGENFIAVATELVGAVGARIVTAVLFVYTFGALISSLRMDVAIFTFVYVDTPAIVLVLTGLAAVAYAAYSGLEVIARVGQLLMPQVLLVLLIGMSFVAPNMHVRNLFPLLEDGLRPVLASGVVQFAQWGEMITIIVLLPYVHNRNALRKHLSRSLGAGSLMMFAIVGTVLLVLGPLAPTTSFKLLEVYRYISVARLVERVDVLLFLTNYFVTFVKTCLLFYVLLFLFCQLFNLRTYQPFILPMGVVGAMFAIITPLTIPRLLSHPLFVLPYNPSVEVAIPTVLLLGCILRRRRPARPGVSS
ncbi:MAG: GerAB/ArcD/ProY family transporter [Desulfotomaculales bacterium]